MVTIEAVRGQGRWSRVFALLVVMIALLAPAVAQVAHAQSSSVVWDEFDVDFVVNEDGSVHVTETQVIQFDGRFSTGFVEIETALTEDLENVQVSTASGTGQEPQPAEETGFFTEQPGTYSVSEGRGLV